MNDAALQVAADSGRIRARFEALKQQGRGGLVTFLTAFAQTPLQFVVLQALTRTFFVTGSEFDSLTPCVPRG